MSIIPALTPLSGTGKPRLIKEFPSSYAGYYQTTGVPTYTATTVVDTVALSGKVLVGRRIRASVVSGSFSTLSYAKITAINTGTKTITVDEWIGGTPTNSQKYTIDGIIADLPRSEKLIENFEPDILQHELYRNVISTKQFGWKYSAEISYETFFSPDIASVMKDILSSTVDGSGNETYILIPRRDKVYFSYSVFIKEPLRVMMHPSKLGHSGIVLVFQGKKNIAVPSMFLVSGYGMNYGISYGTNF